MKAPLRALLRKFGWLSLVWMALLAGGLATTATVWFRGRPEKVRTHPALIRSKLEEPTEGAFQRIFAGLKARQARPAEMDALYARRDRVAQRVEESVEFIESLAKGLRTPVLLKAVRLLEEKGVAAALESLGPPPPPVDPRRAKRDRPAAAAMLLKAELHRNCMDFETARTAAEAAIRLDPQWSATNNRLGILWHDLGDLKAAEAEFRTAVKFAESEPEKAAALFNLAMALRDAGRLAEAGSLLERALEATENCHGPLSPLMVPLLISQAQILQGRDQVSEAEIAMRRALAVQEYNYGAKHPKAAAALNHLVRVLQAAGQLAEVEQLLKRALDICIEHDGPDHPRTATALNNLAGLLRSTHRLAEAEPLARRALAVAEKSLGPKHPKTAAALNNLAQLLQASERLPEAIAMLERVVAIFEESHGPDHPFVTTALDNLASVLYNARRLPDAEARMRRAIAIEEKREGPDHPELAVRLNNLAELLRMTRRPADADALSRQGLLILFKFARSTAGRHPELRVLFENFRIALVAKGLDEPAAVERIIQLAQEAGFAPPAARQLVEELQQ